MRECNPRMPNSENDASPSRTRGADPTPWSAPGARPPGAEGSAQRRSNISRQPQGWHGPPTRSGCTRISSASAPRWHGPPHVVITILPCGVSPLTCSNWSVSTHMAELNEWLTDYRVGPDLPEWARESAEAESAIKSMLTNDSTPSTDNDSSARDKVNGQ